HTLRAYAAYDQARTGTRRDTAVEWALRLLAGRAILDENGQAAFIVVAAVLWAADRLDDAQRLAEGLTRAGEESGSVLLACGAAWLQANVLHRRGALADAEAWFTSAVDTAVARGFTTVTNWAGPEYAIMLAERGAGPAALQVLHRLGLDGPLPDTVHLYAAQLAAGIAKVASGQVREGIDQIRAVGRRWEAIGARNPDLAPRRPHPGPTPLAPGHRQGGRPLPGQHP